MATPSQQFQLGPNWEPSGLPSGAQLGCPIGAHPDLSFRSVQAPLGPNWLGPGQDPHWARTGHPSKTNTGPNWAYWLGPKWAQTGQPNGYTNGSAQGLSGPEEWRDRSLLRPKWVPWGPNPPEYCDPLLLTIGKMNIFVLQHKSTFRNPVAADLFPKVFSISANFALQYFLFSFWIKTLKIEGKARSHSAWA